MIASLPPRRGPRPSTSSSTPHRQLDQQPAAGVADRLAERVFGLAGVHEEPSAISVPGARALVLDGLGDGPPEAFLVGREFAHLHPDPDRSLHLALSPEDARHAIERGWAEPHPAALLGLVPHTFVMVYAARDDEEIDVALALVRRSLAFASAPPTLVRS